MPSQKGAKPSAAISPPAASETEPQALVPAESQELPLDERARAHFQNHPNQFGWIAIALGGVIVLGAIGKWGWIFEGGGGRFNIAAFANTFGMRAAQVVMALVGLALVGAGFGFVYLY